MNREAIVFLLLSALAACGDKPGRPPHSWLFMEARADSWSEGETIVRVELAGPGYMEYKDRVRLDPGERLYAESDGRRVRLRYRDADWFYEGDEMVAWNYEATTDAWEAGSRLDIVYEREGYTGNVRIEGMLPTPFEITDGPSGEVSWDDPVEVAWEPPEDPIATDVVLTVLPDSHDRCVMGEWEHIADSGSYLVPSGALNPLSSDASCTAYLRLYRCREGVPDVDDWGRSTEWKVCQARAMEFVTTP